MTSALDPSGSNSIYMPNTTQIPNVIFDYWMHVLGNAEFKVLLAVCRKTLGWNKKRDNISKKQISDMTGLSKDIVRKAVRCLEEQQLILATVNPTRWGDYDPNTYELNVLTLPQGAWEGGLENKHRGGNPKTLKPELTPESNDLEGDECYREACGGVGLNSSPPGLGDKQTYACPQAPQRLTMPKPKSLKAMTKSMPFMEIDKSLEDAASSPSAFEVLPTEQPKKAKASTRRFPLKKEQQGVFDWLKAQKLNTDDDTLCYWVRTYPIEKLKTAIAFLNHETKRGVSIRTRGGFVRNVLEGKISPVTDTCLENKQFVKDFIEANKWVELEIHEKYVLCPRTHKEVPLSLEPATFVKAICDLFELSQNY